jgi:hypothetical protein
VAHFEVGEKLGDGAYGFCVPLDWVNTVWRDRQFNRWKVRVD